MLRAVHLRQFEFHQASLVARNRRRTSEQQRQLSIVPHRTSSKRTLCVRARSHDEQQGTPTSPSPLDTPLSRRRALLSLGPALSLTLLPLGVPEKAEAVAPPVLGDPSVTIEDVTPVIAPPAKLAPSEEAAARLFEETTYSVVNIFDSTLRPSVNTSGGVEVPEGNGSGLVWDREGHIVTNYHVLGSALSQKRPPGTPVARVSLLGTDGLQRNFQGVLIGADKSKDLAVIRINAPPELLRPLSLGDSKQLRVGQRCYAIGNPFGFDHTLTAGIVSGLNRDIYSANRVVIGGGVQTDAAINPGNSGGPLLDLTGSLIGINTAIFTNTGTSAGVGFAIPTSVVAKIVPQLIAYGKVVRPTLGVQLAADNVARQLGVKTGALVLSVMPGSSAEKVGLLGTRRGFAGNIMLGDVIQSIKDSPVKTNADVEKILDECGIGDSVAVQILRESEARSVNVLLAEGPQ